jgi:hypothetical protein
MIKSGLYSPLFFKKNIFFAKIFLKSTNYSIITFLKELIFFSIFIIN